jgi:hypothetical protein
MGVRRVFVLEATGGAEAPPKCVLLFLLSVGLFIFVERPIHGFRL